MTEAPTKSNRPKVRTHGAADYTGLAESTLEKLRVSGGGPRYIRVGRVVAYDLDDLDAWLEAHKRSSTSEAR
jgi:predicted DNA-binding transcriptional regulator AlpA